MRRRAPWAPKFDLCRRHRYRGYHRHLSSILCYCYYRASAAVDLLLSIYPRDLHRSSSSSNRRDHTHPRQWIGGREQKDRLCPRPESLRLDRLSLKSLVPQILGHNTWLCGSGVGGGGGSFSRGWEYIFPFPSSLSSEEEEESYEVREEQNGDNRRGCKAHCRCSCGTTLFKGILKPRVWHVFVCVCVCLCVCLCVFVCDCLCVCLFVFVWGITFRFISL